MQATYSPIPQRQQRQGNVEQNVDNDTNNDEDEQLIEDESETPKNNPYMRASKAVSMERFFHLVSPSFLKTISLSIDVLISLYSVL